MKIYPFTPEARQPGAGRVAAARQSSIRLPYSALRPAHLLACGDGMGRPWALLRIAGIFGMGCLIVRLAVSDDFDIAMGALSQLSPRRLWPPRSRRWEDSASQAGAEVFWAGTATVPYDPAQRRFDFSQTRCDSTRVFIDVGAHTRAVGPKHAVTLAFEPQLKFWDQLRRSRDCVFAIPSAVSPGQPGFTTFHISENSHSSSLLGVSTKGVAAAGQSAADIESTHDVTTMTLSLDDVISRLTPCSRVEFLKIDAQGFDLKVAESAGAFLVVVDEVEIETPGPSVLPIYEGGATRKDITDFFERMGFVEQRSETSFTNEEGVVMEQNVFFVAARDKDKVISTACPHPDPSICHPVARDNCG